MATANQQIRRVLGVLEFSFDFLNPVTKTIYSVLIQFWTPRSCSCMVSIAFATEAWKEYRTEKAASRAEHEWRQRASLVVSNIKCVCVCQSYWKMIPNSSASNGSAKGPQCFLCWISIRQSYANHLLVPLWFHCKEHAPLDVTGVDGPPSLELLRRCATRCDDDL